MFNVVFTDEGRALIAEIASDIDYSLLISDVKFSDHDYTGQEATVTEATFTGDFASGTNAISVVDSTTMRIESSFNNRYINDQKDLYSIGIFAKCVKVNGMIYTEIDSGLLAVCTVSTPRIIPPYADAPYSVFSYNINLAVGSADNVTVVETQAGVQYKELTTPLTINGNTETTVEGALGGLNDYGDALADNLTANENVYGSKNLNSYPYRDTTKTENGITFTDNGDGTLKVGGSSAQTASDDVVFNLHHYYYPDQNGMYLDQGSYILTGCPNGGGENTYQLFVRAGNSTYYYDNGNGVVFPVLNATTSVHANIIIKSGTTIPAGGITFKPMIRDARIADDTFVPYAQTNLQLTNDKAERNDLATLNLTGSTNTTGAQINAGTFFYLNSSFCKALTNIANGDTFTLNTNFEVVSVGGEISSINDNLSKLEANQYDEAVDISSYTSSSNYYTAPSDGYAYLKNESGQAGTITLIDSTGTALGLIGGNVGFYLVYVKKGLRLVVGGSFANISFFKLKN